MGKQLRLTKCAKWTATNIFACLTTEVPGAYNRGMGWPRAYQLNSSVSHATVAVPKSAYKGVRDND